MYKWTKEQSDDGDDDNYGFKKNTRDTGQSFCRLEREENLLRFVDPPTHTPS